MSFVHALIQIVIFIVIADAILSWVQRPDAMPRKITRQLTQPIYAPIQAIVRPDKIGIDLSPIIVIVALNAISGMLR